MTATATPQGWKTGIGSTVARFRVIGHLRAVATTLDALDGGVKVIVAQTATVGSAVASVNASLAPVRDFAESI